MKNNMVSLEGLPNLQPSTGFKNAWMECPKFQARRTDTFAQPNGLGISTRGAAA
jgi:hypothetical protein